VTIPEGTQSGRQFRLRGKGMPVLRQNHSGDMIVEVHVETPTKLSAKQKQLLKEFEDADGESVFPEFGKFKKRLEGFLKRAAE